LAAARKCFAGLSSRALCRGPADRACRRDRGALGARSDGVSRTPAAPRSPSGLRRRDRGALSARSDGVSRTPAAPRSPRGAPRAPGRHHRRQRAQSRPVWPPSSGATTPPTAFDWRFTATDLDESLARIDGHDKRRSRRPP